MIPSKKPSFTFDDPGAASVEEGSSPKSTGTPSPVTSTLPTSPTPSSAPTPQTNNADLNTSISDKTDKQIETAREKIQGDRIVHERIVLISGTVVEVDLVVRDKKDENGKPILDRHGRPQYEYDPEKSRIVLSSYTDRTSNNPTLDPHFWDEVTGKLSDDVKPADFKFIVNITDNNLSYGEQKYYVDKFLTRLNMGRQRNPLTHEMPGQTQGYDHARMVFRDCLWPLVSGVERPHEKLGKAQPTDVKKQLEYLRGIAGLDADGKDIKLDNVKDIDGANRIFKDYFVEGQNYLEDDNYRRLKKTIDYLNVDAETDLVRNGVTQKLYEIELVVSKDTSPDGKLDWQIKKLEKAIEELDKLIGKKTPTTEQRLQREQLETMHLTLKVRQKLEGQFMCTFLGMPGYTAIKKETALAKMSDEDLIKNNIDPKTVYRKGEHDYWKMSLHRRDDGYYGQVWGEYQKPYTYAAKDRPHVTGFGNAEVPTYLKDENGNKIKPFVGKDGKLIPEAYKLNEEGETPYIQELANFEYWGGDYDAEQQLILREFGELVTIFAKDHAYTDAGKKGETLFSTSRLVQGCAAALNPRRRQSEGDFPGSHGFTKVSNHYIGGLRGKNPDGTSKRANFAAFDFNSGEFINCDFQDIDLGLRGSTIHFTNCNARRATIIFANSENGKSKPAEDLRIIGGNWEKTVQLGGAVASGRLKANKFRCDCLSMTQFNMEYEYRDNPIEILWRLSGMKIREGLVTNQAVRDCMGPLSLIGALDYASYYYHMRHRKQPHEFMYMLATCRYVHTGTDSTEFIPGNFKGMTDRVKGVTLDNGKLVDVLYAPDRAYFEDLRKYKWGRPIWNMLDSLGWGQRGEDRNFVMREHKVHGPTENAVYDKGTAMEIWYEVLGTFSSPSDVMIPKRSHSTTQRLVADRDTQKSLHEPNFPPINPKIKGLDHHDINHLER